VDAEMRQMIATYHTIPYAPWPSSLVTVYRSSTIKSWLKTLKTFLPCKSAMASDGAARVVGGGGAGDEIASGVGGLRVCSINSVEGSGRGVCV